MQQLIAEGETQQAIQEMLSLTDQLDREDLREELLLQSAKYQDYEKGIRQGITSQEQQQILLSRINQALLQIIHQLSVAPNQSGNDKVLPVLEDSGKRPLWQWIVTASVVVGLIAGIAEISGFNLWSLFGSNSGTSPLQLTVYVHGPEGAQDIVLENKGAVMVDFGNRRDKQMIGENGRTNFGEVGSRFLNKEIKISIQAEGFVPTQPEKIYRYDGEPIYVEVKSSCRFCELKGTVQDDTGQLLSGIVIGIKGTELMDTTDQNGIFRIEVPAEQEKKEYILVAIIDGQILWDSFVTPNPDTPIEILLSK